MTPRVLVLGSSNTDLVVKTPRLPQSGETVLGEDYYQAHGGKGANQAVAARRAGAEVTFVAAVGDDGFGRQGIDQYRREGITVDYIKTVAGKPSGVALILVDDEGRNMIAVYPGANWSLLAEDIETLFEAALQGHRVFVTQLESPLATVTRALQKAKEAGLITILNPAPVPRELLADELWHAVDLLTPNEAEAAQLSGVEIHDLASAREAAARLIEKRCPAVIVTLGRQGCLVMNRTDLREGAHLDAPRVQAVDTVAAGDCFVGALACKLAEGSGAEPAAGTRMLEAARWALQAASISVTRRGAQPSLPTRAEIETALAASRA